MSRNVASVQEVKAAQAFLRAIGANSHSNLLIIAVVAWMRQESGSLSRVIGNNPFNIRPGVATHLASGIRRSRRGNGYFLIFPSLEVGLKAAAEVLLKVGGGRTYALVVRAVRRGDPIDFLMALAMSAWDAAHYGLSHGDPSTNHLIRLYATFTGLTLPTPGASEPGQPAPKPKPKPKPRPLAAIPKVLRPPIPHKNYIDGFAARRFYLDRHRDKTGLTFSR